MKDSLIFPRRKLFPATWTFELPCKSKQINVETKQTTVNFSNYYRRKEPFGELFYYKGKSPFFLKGYYKPYNNERLFLFSAPVKVDIEITARCNLSCPHCYFGKKRNKEMDFDLATKILNELHGMKVYGIQLLGGEPTLYSHLVKFLIKAKQLGFKVEMISNGFCINDALIEQTYNKIDYLAISIDGLQDTHNKIRGNKQSYQNAIQIITKFANLGVYVNGLMTVSVKNYREIPQVYLEVVKAGAKGLSVKHLAPFGGGTIMERDCLDTKQKNWTKSIVRQMKMEGKHIKDGFQTCFGGVGHYSFFGCPAGRFSIRIGINGGVYPCVYSNKIFGTFRTESFKNIWRRIQKNLFRGNKNCLFYQRCGGPCLLSKVAKNRACEGVT